MASIECARCDKWIDIDFEEPIPIEIDKKNGIETLFVHERCATDEELEEDI
jgi:hypothetical protein